MIKFEEIPSLFESIFGSIKTLTQSISDIEILRSEADLEFRKEIARLEANISALAKGAPLPVDLPPIRPPAILRRLGLLPEKKAEPPAALRK